jgi:HK97 family phage portal protein
MPQMPDFSIAQAGLKDMSGEWLAFMGINQQRDQLQVYENIRAYGRAPADEAWVYRCMTIKARAAQSVPLRVWVKQGSDRVDAAIAGNSAAEDLNFLLENVNPISMTGADLKAWTQAGIDIWGENYVRKVRGRFGGPPQELYWLRAPDITPRLGRTWIDSFDYRPTWNTQYQEVENYPIRDVIALRRINLQDPSRGLSVIAAVKNQVATLQQATLQMASTLHNQSVPPGAWVAQKGEEVTQQDAGAIRRMLRALRGPANKGKVPVITAPLDWKQIAMSPQDAEWVAAQKLSRMAVCAGFGVPLVMAGDDERTTVYHNMRDAERIFWRMSMIADLDWIADSYNNWLVPDFDPKRQTIEVGFDYSDIEALQDPLVQRQNVALLEVQVNARTINEYRAQFGIGGGKAVDWGNDPILSKLDAGFLQVPQGPVQDQPMEARPDLPSDTDPANATRELVLAEGLRRRYSPRQILDGVPAESYPGLRGLTNA